MSTCHSPRNTGWPGYSGVSFSTMMKTMLDANRSRMNQSRPRYGWLPVFDEVTTTWLPPAATAQHTSAKAEMFSQR
ncbi:hypothetical protein D3C73_1561420 [compost metagenome]